MKHSLTPKKILSKNNSMFKKPKRISNQIFEQIQESIKSKEIGELISTIEIPKEFKNLKSFQTIDSISNEDFFYILTSNHIVTIFNAKKFDVVKQIELQIKESMICISTFKLVESIELFIAFENKILILNQEDDIQRELKIQEGTIQNIIQIGMKMILSIERDGILVLNPKNLQFENHLKKNTNIEFLLATKNYIWCVCDKSIQIIEIIVIFSEI
jgi:hypothetical protein